MGYHCSMLKVAEGYHHNVLQVSVIVTKEVCIGWHAE